MKKTITRHNTLRATLASFLLLASFFSQAQNGGVIFQKGPSMSRTKIYPTACLMSNGKLISFGGREEGFISSSFADIYDPTTNTFSETQMNYTHDMGAVAKLSDGRYFIAGGSMNSGVPAYATSEIYDPLTGIFTPKASMLNSRTTLNAVQLTGGKVLLAGAWYNNSAASYGELYDIATDAFTATGGLITARSQALLLPTSDGGAILAGGWDPYGGPIYTSTEYYDPSTNNFTALNSELIPTDAGWQISPIYNRTIEDLRMTNGKYLLLASRNLSATEFAFIEFDPSTKLFSKFSTTLPLLDSVSNGGFYDFVLNKTGNYVYLLGVKANNDPLKICLVSVNLSDGQVYHPTTSFTLPAQEYPNPSMTYLPASGKILLQGISSYPDNFNATNKTYLLTPQQPNVNIEYNSNPFGHISLYPNPSTNLINLRIENLNLSDFVLNIYNVTGKQVFSKNIPNTSITPILDISELEVGIYFLRMTSDNRTLYDTKIVIER